MATTETRQYRGYKIVPMRQWANWCAAFPTRADLPFLTHSTHSTLAARKGSRRSRSQTDDRPHSRARLNYRALVLTLVVVFGVGAKGHLSPRELFKPPSDPLTWEPSECDDPTLERGWASCIVLRHLAEGGSYGEEQG